VPVRDAATIPEKVSLIAAYIRDPSIYPDTTAEADESTQFGTSGAKANIIQRYSLLQSIDMLALADRQQGYTGIDRYVPVLYSFVPHLIWPDRPVPISTNELGHKAGFAMDPNDTSTGIAIGSPVLFFDMGGWPALAVYSLALFLVFFFITLRVAGTTETSVWGLVLIGTEALIAGAAGPGEIFSIMVLFLTTFLAMMGVLKVLGYVSEAFVARHA
jgi:hypothetical protein